MSNSPADSYLKSMLERGRKQKAERTFDEMDESALMKLPFKQIAAIQAQHQPGDAVYILCSHAIAARLTDAQVRAMSRAGWVGGLCGVAGTLLGALLGWYLGQK